MTPLQLPKSIGGYEILRPLASGGMGAVLLGEKVTAQGWKKRVAIKVILPHLLGDAQARALFFDEARLAARFNHPNLVQVYDFGEEDGFFHLVMEFVEGASVLSILQRNPGPIEAGVAARIVVEAARGLAWAHSAVDDQQVPLGVVHRDISPDNLFVTSSGGTKVLDFGIARSRERSAVSVVGLVRGKPAYMAPEHLQGEVVDGRADVWSLGVVFTEMLTGKRLFVGDGMALARRVLEEPLPLSSLSSLAIAPSLTAIARSMLVRDVAARPTMTEVVAALENSGEVALPTAVLPALSSRMPSPASSSSSAVASSPAVAPRDENEQTALLRPASPVAPVAVVTSVAAAGVGDTDGTADVTSSPRKRRTAAAMLAAVFAAAVAAAVVVVVVSGFGVGAHGVDAGVVSTIVDTVIVDAAIVDAALVAAAIVDAGSGTAEPIVTVADAGAAPSLASTRTPRTAATKALAKTATTAATAATTTPGSAALYVPDRRPWVDVFVDGVKVGVSPLGSRRRPFVVAAGAHRLKLVDPATGATVLDRVLQLEAGAVEEVR